MKKQVSCTLKVRGGGGERCIWQKSRKGSVDSMGKVGNTRSEPRSDIVCLEGNGSRPSHRGDGYLESQVMYTLNSTEVHAIAYGIEPGAAQRLDPSKRVWREQSPTLRANAGDNQVSVAWCKGTEDEIHSIGTPSERFEDKDSRGRNLSEPDK